jgi:DNA-binding transcriptional LysR family regulator
MYNHQLDTFLKVAELGSFGKAADALFISAPAVIQQINLLEGECGVRLFIRTNHGVRLTPAGASLLEDAKTIVRLSKEAVSKAQQLEHSGRTTVRIGTSLLYKCRLLPDIWSRINGQFPDLKIEILPLPETQENDAGDSVLGVKYDIREGVYCTIAEKDSCSFLELIRTPFCCAVAKGHRLAKLKKVTMEDLNGEYLVMPISGVSTELDTFRQEIVQHHPTVQIIDSTYYGVDTFTLCEVNPYILITQQIYQDIHPNLVTIPLRSEYSMPYGLIYAKSPNDATKQFIKAIKKIQMALKEKS